MRTATKIVLLSIVLAVASHAGISQINVYVTAKPSPDQANVGGFVDPLEERRAKERADSAQDIKKRMAKKFHLVDSADTADVIVDVIDRGHATTGDLLTYRDLFGGGLRTSEEQVLAVYVELRASDYKTKFTGLSMTSEQPRATDCIWWRCAAASAAWKIEQWINANRERLIALRSKSKNAAPPVEPGPEKK